MRRTARHGQRLFTLRLFALCFLLCAITIEEILWAEGPKYGIVRGDVRFGAFPDDRGPIGGGDGYSRPERPADLTATDAPSLLAALARAEPGQVVEVPGDVAISFHQVDEGKPIIVIPEGVTLVGGRGGGKSAGATLRCLDPYAKPFIHVVGNGVRISGLRIEGPDPFQHMDIWSTAYMKILPKYGRDAARAYYYSFPSCVGIQVEGDGFELDNCEVTGWSHAGIFLKQANSATIHHCFIHLNQRHGLGYGITHDKATSEISYCIFEDNRHSIAGTGHPESGYWAHDNIEFGVNIHGQHRFDMHGGYADNEGRPVAGGKILISNNVFLSKWMAVRIRGFPVKSVTVRNNIFMAKAAGSGVVSFWPGSTNSEVFDNIYDGLSVLPGVKPRKGK